MAIELLGVTNIGLKITDNLTIPAIRAILRGSDTTYFPASDMRRLQAEILGKATGLIVAGGVWASGGAANVNAAMGSLVAGTYGSNTGFKLVVSKSIGGGGSWGYANAELYYNNNLIQRMTAYGGYTTWETSGCVIFTDENYNLVESRGAYGIYQRMSGNPGIAIINNQFNTFPLSDVSTLYQSGANVDFIFTNTNIKDLIPSEIDPDVTDPYGPGGESGPGGGDGDFDWFSDPIDFPPLPTLSATDTGFITLFNPSLTELQNLANYMWNDLSIDNFHKVFNNPMDAILGLSIVPVAVPDGGQKSVIVGNIFAVNIQMNVAASQYVEVDCGSINVKEHWGAYLDYDPYTKAEIYLPYIGVRPIKTDDIMKKTIHVKYHVDILSGACCAYVKCGDSILYTFVGQCSASVPISGGDWTNVINGVLQMATAIGAMVATEGAATPFVASQLIQGASAASKPQIEKSGGMSGTGGMMAYQKPYLILTRPRQALPKNQNRYTGYPSMITMQLGDCSGYTEIEAINLEGLTATAEEMAEIENLLKGGVLF